MEHLDLIRKLELSGGYTGLNSHTLGRFILYLKWDKYPAEKKEILATEIRKSMVSGNWKTPSDMVY